MAKQIGTRDDDELEGGGGKDRLEGRGGDDRLVGRGGKDRLIGGAGDDDLNGGDAGDQLEGGGGNDTLRGGDGNDVLDPGSSGGDGDVIIGGKGDDRIDFSAGAYTLTYSRLATALEVRLGDATGTVDKGGQGTDTLRGLGAIVSVAGLTVVGGSGDDLIKASLGARQFARLIGGDGDDTIVGGTGFDQLAFSSDGATGVAVRVTGYKGGGMTGRATDPSGGTDSFRKMNEVRGTENDDTFRGRGETDRFVASAGEDSYRGGNGTDDLLRFNRIGIGSVEVDLLAGTASVVAGDGTFAQTLTGIEHIRGSEASGDRLFGSNEEDQLETFDGKDLLEGRDGKDALSAGAGADTLRGGNGGDRLFGQKGKDRINGDGGDDRLDGGTGADRLEGGAGADVFEFGRRDDNDRILDFADGTDLISIRNGADAFSDLTISGAADATITFAEVEIVVTGVAASDLSSEDFLFG